MEWNVLDFGAVADGETDNTAAFQKALDAAEGAAGGTVTVPTGHYRFDGTLTVPGSVTLEGIFRVPPTNRCDGRAKLDGSVLLAYAGRGEPKSAPFLRLAGSMATVKGFMIFYPEWKQSDVPPVPYPPTITGAHVDNVGVLDCLLINSYEGLHFQGVGRMLVRNVYGYPSYRGLYIDRCLDIGRVENCHFWPFNTAYNPKDPYSEWINVNGVAFEFARTDWQYCTNTFCFGYGVGYKFSTSEHGSCNGNFTGIGADSCRRAVLVDTHPGTIDLLITNGEFVGRWGSMDSVGVEVTGDTTQRVSLNNCAFWGPLDQCIWVNAPEGQLAATACGFNDWDIGATGAPAVCLDSGKAILQGCSFQKEGLHVRIGEAVQSAILLGNQAGTGLRVENLAGDRTQMVANETDRLVWTERAKGHYRIDVGAPGDSRYLSRMHGREKALEWGEDGGTKRWFSEDTALALPVVPGRAYTLEMDLNLPAHALDEGNGIYLRDQRLASLPEKAGHHVLACTVPPQEKDVCPLVVRVKGWVPAALNEESSDGRTLGVAVRSLTMRADTAAGACFDANTGEWVDEE